MKWTRNASVLSLVVAHLEKPGNFLSLGKSWKNQDTAFFPGKRYFFVKKYDYTIMVFHD